MFLPSLPRGAVDADFVVTGRDLFALIGSIRVNKVTFSLDAIQAFHRHAKSYLRIMASYGLKPKPKDHMLMHLSLRIQHMGSPALYGNWIDESVNRLLRDVSAGAHAAVHDRRVLAEFPRALENENKRRRAQD